MSKVDYSELSKLDSEKKVDAFVEKALTGVKKANIMLQVALIAILSHFARSGNWQGEKVNKLCTDERLSGMQTTLITGFFTTYGGYKRLPGESGFTSHQGAEFVKEHFEAAKAHPWFETGEEQNPFKDMTLADDLDSLFKRYRRETKKAAKMVEAGQEDQARKINTDLTESIMQQLANLGRYDSIIIHSDRIKVEAVESKEPANDPEVDQETDAAETEAA